MSVIGYVTCPPDDVSSTLDANADICGHLPKKKKFYGPKNIPRVAVPKGTLRRVSDSPQLVGGPTKHSPLGSELPTKP